MNRTSLLLVASLALLSTPQVFAQEATSDAWTTIVSSVDCDQAAVAMAQARTDGSLHFGDTGYFEPVVSVKTRAQVLAATLAARDSGELAAINGEAYRGFTPQSDLRLARSGR